MRLSRSLSSARARKLHAKKGVVYVCAVSPSALPHYIGRTNDAARRLGEHGLRCPFVQVVREENACARVHLERRRHDHFRARGGARRNRIKPSLPRSCAR